MEFSLETSTGNQIYSYEPGCIVINQTTYRENLIITPTVIIAPWDTSDYEALINLNPEVVILGNGETQYFPPPQIIAQFGGKKIGLECMRTISACHTFNVLAAEGRNVIAGLQINLL